MKETCLHALTALLVVLATGLLPVSAQNDATNRPPIQTFYLPIPEEDLLQTLTSIHGGASYTVRAATALDAFEDYIPVDGEGLDNMGYYHMEATPPYNTAVIDLNGEDARFFKIRVDNLANEVR